MNQSVPSTVTPKIFQALVSRICEFTEWDVYPGEGIRVVKFHILHFLWKEKYIWYSREVHVEMLSSKLLVLLYFFHLYGFIHLWHRFAMELLPRKHCFLEESNEESNLSQKTFVSLLPGWGNKTYWYAHIYIYIFCMNLLAPHPMFTASFRKKGQIPDLKVILHHILLRRRGILGITTNI